MSSTTVSSFGESGQRHDDNGLWWPDLIELGDALQAVIDALSAHIAILDASGTILAINHAWRQFARTNGLNDECYVLGANYLSVCEAAQGKAVLQAQAAAQGIRDVLQGRRDTYAMEYWCSGPQQNYWFRLRVQPLPAQDGGQVIVAHEDITEFRQLQATYRFSGNYLQR